MIRFAHVVIILVLLALSNSVSAFSVEKLYQTSTHSSEVHCLNNQINQSCNQSICNHCLPCDGYSLSFVINLDSSYSVLNFILLLHDHKAVVFQNSSPELPPPLLS